MEKETPSGIFSKLDLILEELSLCILETTKHHQAFLDFLLLPSEIKYNVVLN